MKTTTREVRQYQLGLILLGMAMARASDCDKIDAALSRQAIPSEPLRGAIDAVVRYDGAAVKQYFASRLGVRAGSGRVIDAIIDKLHAMEKLDQYDNAMQEAIECTGAETVEGLRDRLEKLVGVLS